MFFTAAQLIARLFGFDISKVQKWLSIAVFVAILAAIVIAGGLIWKACSRPPRLDEKQIQKAEQAIKTRNDAELKRILAESDTRVDNVDAGIKQAEENTRKAVQKYDGLSTDELAAEIERRKNQ